MSEMAPEDVRPLLCAVCSSPLPPPTGKRGRPRKVCRDEDSPIDGGCRAFRRSEHETQRKHTELPARPGVKRQQRGTPPWEVWPAGGFLIIDLDRKEGHGQTTRITPL